jgi:hypothetical protein
MKKGTIGICATLMIGGCSVEAEDPMILIHQQELALAKLRLTQANFEAQCAARTPVIGMTKDEELTKGWCGKHRVNTTETAAGTREQWVFPDLGYLYFENSRLVTIQRSN